MEIKSEGAQLPLDSVDLTYHRKYVRTRHTEKRPMWTRKCLDGESEYCHVEVVTQDEDCYSEETFDAYYCHICNIEVPVLCFKKHNESEKHATLKTIFQIVLERVSKQINISVIDNDKDIEKDVYYCDPCSKIIKIENKHKHESSQYHVKSQKSINVVREFYKIFEENKDYVGVKEVYEILDEKRFGTEIIQNDTKKNNVKDVTNEDKSNSDETKTDCSTNDYTIKPTCTVEHLEPKDKIYNEELTSEENYFKDMVKEYNLKVNLPIVDGEFIHVTSPSGVKVKIARDHFHSYLSLSKGIRVYCQMCNKPVALREESKHKFSEKHARNIFLPVNEQFARTFNDYSSHCLICNKVDLTSTLSKDHLYIDIHVKLFNSAKLTDICQNNEDLANGINTETDIERAQSENHVNYSEENMIIKCINNKEYISKVNLSEIDVGDGHIARTKDATAVQKLVFCKLCDVSVPREQMEYHNAGTPHWSNTLKKICTDVADGLQAYFSKGNLKTDSDSSEKQNDTLENDNVAKQNDTLKNDNVTKQNKTPKNYNVSNQNDTLKNDNVAKQNDALKNDNEAKQNKTPKNYNVSNQNETLKNDNVGKHNKTPKNDNVSNQNETLENDNVAKQNKTPKNYNVSNQNETLENDNVASTSVSNITNNEIYTTSSFRFNSMKNKVTCIICDVDIANVLQSIKKHEASLNHNLHFKKLLNFHTIRKNPKHYFCECCCGTNVTNIWAHIGTEKHTALLQLEYEIELEALKLFNYKSNKRNNNGIMFRELYKMLLESNRIYKLPISNFYCAFCEHELLGEGNEIDHMFSKAHEKWLKIIFKSR